MRHKVKLAIATLALAAVWVAPAYAQDDASALMGMSVSALKSEIGNRYDAALKLTLDAEVVSADDPRHLWASQAKAQCGIAIGFLKSGTKDPVSIGKCQDAYTRMQARRPAVVMAQPAPEPQSEACTSPIAGIVFFDWDSAVPPQSAIPTLQGVAKNLQDCGWKGVAISGHTDRSGSDQYNFGLSTRRAQAVAAMMVQQGTDNNFLQVVGRGESEPKVPTPDGERNPSNRRVEITVIN